MGIQTDCIAIDIGASGGRILVGSLSDDRISCRQIHRFSNTPKKIDGKTLWDLEGLYAEIIKGLSHPVSFERRPKSLGIDTWGVDYVIVDRAGNIRGNTFSYRDGRTEDIPERVFRFIEPERLYQKTGIQIQRFNTLFQLSAVSDMTYAPDDRFLMIPDWLNYRLTGSMVNEFTNLTTTQLCERGSGKPDGELLTIVGLPAILFPRMVRPGTPIGRINDERLRETSTVLGIPVIAPGTHDTASAVASIPDPEGGMPLFISSGTWSLMGAETESPITTEGAFRANFTNEGGVDGRNRLLKNIMGLWLLQRVRTETDGNPSFTDLENLARDAEPFRSLIDPQDDRFLDPPSMTEAIRSFCREHGEPVPETGAHLARCIYDSLALSYRATLAELESITARRFPRLHIIGGGSQDKLLCQLAADVTGLEVLSGPVEATAVGNCLVQFMGQGSIPSLAEGRALIRESFGTLKYPSRELSGLDGIARRFAGLQGASREFQ